MVLGIILFLAGVHRATNGLFQGGSSGASSLVYLGFFWMGIGGMLVNAGLIGAAMGADPRNLTSSHHLLS